MHISSLWETFPRQLQIKFFGSGWPAVSLISFWLKRAFTPCIEFHILYCRERTYISNTSANFYKHIITLYLIKIQTSFPLHHFWFLHQTVFFDWPPFPPSATGSQKCFQIANRRVMLGDESHIACRTTSISYWKDWLVAIITCRKQE